MIITHERLCVRILSNPTAFPHASQVCIVWLILKWSLEAPGTETELTGGLQTEQLGLSGVLNMFSLLIWLAIISLSLLVKADDIFLNGKFSAHYTPLYLKTQESK